MELFKQAKKKVKNESFLDKGDGRLCLNEAKKAITDFKKLTGDEFKTAELMLYYVELGVEYTNSFGDIYESFYSSMETMYEKVLQICSQREEIFNALADRLKQVY